MRSLEGKAKEKRAFSLYLFWVQPRACSKLSVLLYSTSELQHRYMAEEYLDERSCSTSHQSLHQL